MGKHFLTRLAEAEEIAEQVIANKVPPSLRAEYRAFFRHPETRAGFHILLRRKVDIDSDFMSTLLRHPVRVAAYSIATGGTYPKELKNAKRLKGLSNIASKLAVDLEDIEFLHDAAPHEEATFFNRVKAVLPGPMGAGAVYLPNLLDGVAKILGELAEKGPPVPEVYATLKTGKGKQPNPYVDWYVYTVTREFRNTYRSPLFQVTAHFLNGAMNLPDSKKYTGRKVFEIYRRLKTHARRKKKPSVS